MIRIVETVRLNLINKNKNMTKKRILVFTGIVSVLLAVLNYIGTFNLCGGQTYGVCMDIIFDLIMLFVPIILLFIFSLITYSMKENVFQSWWKFARIWIPISMFAILISPSNSHNWMFPVEKGTVAFFSSALFLIISLILITIWQIKERRNQNK